MKYFFLIILLLSGALLSFPLQAQVVDQKQLDQQFIDMPFDKVIQDETKQLVNYNDVIFSYVGDPITQAKDIVAANAERVGINTLRFYPSDQFIELQDGYHYIGYATTTYQKFYNEYFQIKPLSFWFVPTALAQTYSGAGDGSVKNDTGNWATVHDAVSGTADYVSATTLVAADDFSDPTYQIYRVFLPFNTASLPDGCTVTAAELGVATNGTKAGDNSITVVEGQQDSTSELVSTDYNNFATTELVDARVNSWTTDTYSTFDLNAAGRALVSDDGYTKLMLQDSYDFEDSASAKREYLTLYMSEQADTTYDPYLDITYTESSSTPPTATTTASCIPDNLNNIGFVTACSFASSSGVTYTNYHIPFLVWFVFWSVLSFIFGSVVIIIHRIVFKM